MTVWRHASSATRTRSPPAPRAVHSAAVSRRCDVVLVWLVLCVALVLFELHHLAFYALFVAIGSLAGGAVALFAPDAYALQTIMAVVVSIAGVILVRPYASQAFHR